TLATDPADAAHPGGADSLPPPALARCAPVPGSGTRSRAGSSGLDPGGTGHLHPPSGSLLPCYPAPAQAALARLLLVRPRWLGSDAAWLGEPERPGWRGLHVTCHAPAASGPERYSP